MDSKLLDLNTTRRKMPIRATSGMFKALTVVACLTVASGIAHADQTGSINWGNAAQSPLRVTLQSSNSCVTDAGPSTFAVKKNDTVANELKVKPGCDVSVVWNFTQDRKGGTGQVAGRIYYVQLSGGQARISITYTQLPNHLTRHAHFFRAACGRQLLTCLNNTVPPLPNKQPRAWIYSMALPTEMIGPMRFG